MYSWGKPAGDLGGTTKFTVYNVLGSVLGLKGRKSKTSFIISISRTQDLYIYCVGFLCFWNMIH